MIIFSHLSKMSGIFPLSFSPALCLVCVNVYVSQLGLDNIFQEECFLTVDLLSDPDNIKFINPILACLGFRINFMGYSEAFCHFGAV